MNLDKLHQVVINGSTDTHYIGVSLTTCVVLDTNLIALRLGDHVFCSLL